MNKQEILEMLRHAEPDAIYSFISAYAESNTEFCKQLKTALLPGNGDDLNKEEYLAKAENCFDFEVGGWRRGRYDDYQAANNASNGLDRMLSDADYLIEQEELAPAVGIAMAVVEVIPRNYESVDDSGGSLGDTFERAANLIVTILHDKQTPERLKQEIYGWVRQEMKNRVYSDYSFFGIEDVFEAACIEVGETDEVLAYFDKWIAEAKEYWKGTVELRKIRFMLSRNLDTCT